MRRLLRRSRSFGGIGDSKSVSRGRHVEDSVSVGVSSHANGGRVDADMKSLKVPELHRGCAVSDDDEHPKTVTDWTKKSQRSLTQRVDQQSDSGCEVGAEATAFGVPWRWRVLERQDEIMSCSRRSSTMSPTSSTSFVRFRRQRASLRSFRIRSEQFLRRRMRPSCLRRGCDSDDTYGPARRPSSENVTHAAVGSWLAAPRTVSGVDGCEQRLSVDAVMPSRSRQSSRSDVTTVPSSGDDVSVCNDHVSSLDSSTSATFPTVFRFQV